MAVEQPGPHLAARRAAFLPAVGSTVGGPPVDDGSSAGRKPDPPGKHLYRLALVAETRCHRIELSVRSAAQFVVQHHGGKIGWDRLAALYRPRSRELEIMKMSKCYRRFTWMDMDPVEWIDLVERAEKISQQHPSVEETARQVPKMKVSTRRHLPFSLWRPAELLDLLSRLKHSGIPTA